MTLDLSRRAFMAGLFGAALAGALVPTPGLGREAHEVAWAADPPLPWRPSESDVDAWLEGYKARVLVAVEHQAAFHRMTVETETILQTREWFERANEMEALWSQFDALRRRIGQMHGAGYVEGRDHPDMRPRDLPADDEGFSYWNGYRVGLVDRARDRRRYG